MPQWENKDFDVQAGRLVEAWASTRNQGGASLTALAEKTARDHALSTEQIRRLCRVSNSKAFNVQFEEMAKTGGDRVVDFETAKEDEVIAALHKAAETKTAAQTAAYPDLADQFAPMRERPSAFSKEAHDLREVERELTRALPPDPPKTAQLLHKQKAAAELRGRVSFEESRAREALAKLATLAARVGFDADRFEKDAMAAHGLPALPAINLLRARRGVAPLVVATEKSAALLDRLVGRATEEVRLVGAAIHGAAEALELKTAADVLDHDIATLRTELFGETS